MICCLRCCVTCRSNIVATVELVNSKGYASVAKLLCALDFGLPTRRLRYFIFGPQLHHSWPGVGEAMSSFLDKLKMPREGDEIAAVTLALLTDLICK